MKRVVHAVDDERSRLAGHVEDTFDAEQLVRRRRAQRAEPALEAVPIEWRIRDEAEAPDGRVVVFMGDDDDFEYIYRFVTRDPATLAIDCCRLARACCKFARA